jgi:spore maturation protein CgeB
MKIFYVSVIEQNAGFGAEWFMERAFRSLNHLTYCVDYREHRHHLVPFFWNAPQCDVFFLQRGDYFPISLIEMVQTPRFFWASELVSRCRDQDRLLRRRIFDHVFYHSQACIETVVERGWADRQDCSVLLNGFDELLFKPIPGVEKDIDIVFVGNITPRRRKLLEDIEKYQHVTVTTAFGEEFVRLINRAKIVLNIHADDYLDTETRVFETLGCGAFLLSERLSQENPFSNDELVQAGSLDELVAKLDHYLREEDKRAAIARNGYQAAIHGHTYLHRAQEILQVMSPFVKMKKDPPAATVRKDWRMLGYGVEEAVIRFGQPLVRAAKGFVNEHRHRNHLV